MGIGRTLEDLIRARGTNVNELSHSIGTSPSTLYSIIRRDNMKVDFDLLLRLCAELAVDISYFYDSRSPADPICQVTPAEYQWVLRYRQLDGHGRDMVDTVLDKELSRTKSVPFPQKEKYVAFYSLPVSAGTGVYLDDGGDSRLLRVPANELTSAASYALRVSGDSMEPDYRDGDILLVKSQPQVEPGELGIFILNNQGYFKRRGARGLESLNPRYSLITVTDYDSFRCIGRVLCKLPDTGR